MLRNRPDRGKTPVTIRPRVILGVLLISAAVINSGALPAAPAPEPGRLRPPSLFEASRIDTGFFIDGF